MKSICTQILNEVNGVTRRIWERLGRWELKRSAAKFNAPVMSPIGLTTDLIFCVTVCN